MLLAADDSNMNLKIRLAHLALYLEIAKLAENFEPLPYHLA